MRGETSDSFLFYEVYEKIASFKTGDVLHKGEIINTDPMSKDEVHFDAVKFD